MSFTLYLNSENGTKVVVGSTQAVSYNFNWSVLEENSNYELTFNFTSKNAGNLTASSQYALKLTGLGALTNTYNITSLGVSTSTEIIGIVHPQDVGAGGGGGAGTHYLYAGYEVNPPVFIKNRPNGNNFRVEIVNLNGSNGVVFTAEWGLVLHFKKVGN